MNITDDWNSVELKNIQLKDWKNLAFFNPSVYTIALKNIKGFYFLYFYNFVITYIFLQNAATITEKIFRPVLPFDPVHYYQDKNYIKTESLSVFAHHMDIHVIEKMFEISEKTFFTFNLRLPELNIEEKINLLFNRKNNKCEHQIKIDIPQINIQCYLDQNRKTKKFFLNMVSISLNKNQRNISMIEVRDFQAQTKILNIQPAINNHTSKRLIYLVDSQPDNLDVCYKISKHQFSEVTVYITFANQNSGTKLLTIERLSEQEFCINHYFALKNLKRYQLTFEIPLKNKDNHETPDAALYIARRTIDNTRPFPSFNILYPWTKPFDANYWLFSNPHFDYSFTGTNVHVLYGMEHPQFKICDATANCFKLDFNVKKDKVNNKEISTYTIPESAKTILKTSPFVKIDFLDRRPLDPNDINTDRLYFDNVFDFGYSKATFVMRDLLKEAIVSANVNIKSTAQIGIRNITFKETISSSGQLNVNFPLNSLDFRIYILQVTIKTKTDFLILKQVSFTSDNSEETNDLTELFTVQL